jgi:hypothetical protein
MTSAHERGSAPCAPQSEQPVMTGRHAVSFHSLARGVVGVQRTAAIVPTCQCVPAAHARPWRSVHLPNEPVFLPRARERELFREHGRRRHDDGRVRYCDARLNLAELRNARSTLKPTAWVIRVACGVTEGPCGLCAGEPFTPAAGGACAIRKERRGDLARCPVRIGWLDQRRTDARLVFACHEPGHGPAHIVHVRRRAH